MGLTDIFGLAATAAVIAKVGFMDSTPTTGPQGPSCTR